MIWSCMSAKGADKVFLRKGCMNSNRHLNILEGVLKTSIVKLDVNDPLTR